MDKRISFLNRLKHRLNDYIFEGDHKNEGLRDSFSHYQKVSGIDFSRIRAHMLVDNLPIGMALNHSSFDNAGVYAEFTSNGVFRFHIYPKINNIDHAPQEESAFMHDKKTEKALKKAHMK
jgi:hypothetical protein